MGFKDWIPRWKAENWNPDSLVALYKRCGAKYFVAMANHHDNFDNYDSKYQPWNSVNMGPKTDIIARWAAAAKHYGLPFGVSVHLAHAWTFYEKAQGSDKTGPLAGVPYDGRLTKADGKGTWWEGYDIQDLYEQRHQVSKDNSKWDWETDYVTTPDQAYCDRVYNRTVDLINKYDPQMIYFDDTFVPLWPISDCGLKILSHFYNKNMAEHKGRNEAVATGKVLTEDVGRGARCARRHTAAPLADVHVHRLVALRQMALLRQHLQDARSGDRHVYRHREQERHAAAERRS